MKKIVCWAKSGHEVLEVGDDLPENADILASWGEIEDEEIICPFCGQEISREG